MTVRPTATLSASFTALSLAISLLINSVQGAELANSAAPAPVEASVLSASNGTVNVQIEALKAQLQQAQQTIQKEQLEEAALQLRLAQTEKALADVNSGTSLLAQTLQKTKAETAHQLAESTKALEATRHEIAGFRADMQKAQAEQAKLREEIGKRDRQLAKNEQTLAANRQAAEKLQTELQQARADSTKLLRGIAERDQRLGESAQALEASHQETMKMQLLVQQAQAKNAQLVQKIEAQARDTAQTIAAHRQETVKLQSEIQTIQNEKAQLAKDISTRDQRLAESVRALAAGHQETIKVQAELRTAQDENAQLRQEVVRSHTEAVAVAEQLTAARAQLPTQYGGTATPDSLRATAHTSAEHLAAAHKEALQTHTPEAKAAYDKAVTTLAQDQLRLAVALEARGVYRVRPREILTRVAKHEYGSGRYWTEIYQANQHVLESANHLPPDVSLVIP